MAKYPCPRRIKEDTKRRFLNLGLNIKDKILRVFFSIFFQKGKKKSNNIQIFFLLLEIKQINSRATLDSSFIKVSKEGTFSGSTFNFLKMDMAKLSASLSNQ
jgi:hypothetical protein